MRRRSVLDPGGEPARVAPPNDRPRSAYIDGLRGLAVACVIAFHVAAALQWTQPTPLGYVLRQGQHGVDLFFIISGICLTRSALKYRSAEGRVCFDLARYVAQRTMRIVPPYWAAVVLSGLLVGCGIISTGKLAGIDHAFGPADFIREALFLDRGTAWSNAVFWTLAVEWRWYALFPLLLALRLRSRKAFLATLPVVVVIYYATLATNVDLGMLPAFMLGMLAADASFTRAIRAPWLLAGASLAVSPLVWILADGMPLKSPNLAWIAFWFFAVVAVERGGWARYVLESRLPTALGAMSYSAYLVQSPIIEAVAPAGGRTASPFVLFAAVTAGAGVFYLVVERPMLRSGFARRWKAALEILSSGGLERLGVPRTVELSVCDQQTADCDRSVAS